MNPPLHAGHALDLINQLKLCLTTTAAKEAELTEKFRQQRFLTERQCAQAEKVLDDKLTAHTQQVNELCDALEAQALATFETRKKKMERFRHSSSRDLAPLSQKVRERYLGSLQMKRVTAERELANARRNAKQHSADEASEIASQGEGLGQLERAAKAYFGGYGAFLNLLKAKAESAQATPMSAEQTARALEEQTLAVRAELKQFKSLFLPRLFSLMPMVALIVVAAAVGACIAYALAAPEQVTLMAVLIVVGMLVVVFGLHRIGWMQGKALASSIAEKLAHLRRLQAVSAAYAADETNQPGSVPALEAKVKALQDEWARADEVQETFVQKLLEKIATKVPDMMEKNEALYQSKLRYVELEREARLGATSDLKVEEEKLKAKRAAAFAAMDAEEAQAFATLESDFHAKADPLAAALETLKAAAPAHVPTWSASYVEAWSPPAEFSPATRLAEVRCDLTTSLPKSAKLQLPISAKLSAPIMLGYPEKGSLLIETNTASDGTASATINNVLLRLLTATPPGKVAMTILDPVGLGQNFAGVMHLGDYEDTLINRRIWTQRDQIEERLAELNEHIEKVIQMYLRNEYETITQYNAEAGSVAEKYQFLVVADFPANFSDVAVKRLQSIAVSGPRCGVFTLIHWDKRGFVPEGFVPDELRASSVVIQAEGSTFLLMGAPPEAKLLLDAPPSDELAVDLLHRIGKASIDSNRVQVPFTQIAPKPDELWTNDTTHELRVPIGRTGATKLQYLAIGKGTRQHALFAGKTGSGKSTLFHIIITNLALHSSPDEVEFYLIDFKKGVEFKCYATHKLPHARVVAIESDREFGLSVLQRVDEELKRRGDMFRKLGAQDIAGYKRAGGTEPMPRCLLLIDEFQEFFTEDDTVAQHASVLFDRIVRQGRAFGIHVILGSQTLGGAFTLAKATMGQMVIRVALQCNEADAYLIMDENNPAPRLLTRPGEGIYNDAAGALEGNSPFQVCWLGDEERDQWLNKVAQLAGDRYASRGGPIVFEGNAPADIRENYLLAALLKKPAAAPPVAARMWLGAPNSIKGPTEAVFHRQSGSHLLVVGQREDVSLNLLGLGLIALGAQFQRGEARFYLLHATPEGTPEDRFLAQCFKACRHDVNIVRGHELSDALTTLADDLRDRLSGDAPNAVPVFVMIAGLHKFKKLKADDDMDFSFGSSDSGPSPSAQLSTLITEGSAQGIHLIAATDSYNNVTRFLSRKLLSEFEMRVVWQMSANDSASLIDSPQASNLGLHRAMLHNEQAGTLETFRPYAEPESAWFEEVG